LKSEVPSSGKKEAKLHVHFSGLLLELWQRAIDSSSLQIVQLAGVV
jgi:hypothetical protein